MVLLSLVSADSLMKSKLVVKMDVSWSILCVVFERLVSCRLIVWWMVVGGC